MGKKLKLMKKISKFKGEKNKKPIKISRPGRHLLLSHYSKFQYLPHFFQYQYQYQNSQKFQYQYQNQYCGNALQIFSKFCPMSAQELLCIHSSFVDFRFAQPRLHFNDTCTHRSIGSHSVQPFWDPDCDG